MSRSRLESFSDGVIAILITIMVLELRVPQGTDLAALAPMAQIFASYVLSFVFLGIYWSNHHHMLQMASRVNGKILWANLHLLFWLSLIPYVTSWMGQTRPAPVPTALYGAVLLGAAIAYTILQTAIIRFQGPDSRLKAAVQSDLKGKISIVCYLAAIPLAFVSRWISVSLYILVALMWFVPDRRIERKVSE